MFVTTPKRLSQIAESLLWLDGKPFSLADYPMYRAVYDGRYRSTMLMCGRQVGKSSSLANFVIAESVSIPHFREYYLAPSKEQTLIFSNTRVGKVLSYSPLVRKYFQSPETSDRVLHRSYTNGSENAFTYACDDADRARGFSADRVCYDANTQVLTRQGWKLVADVTYDDELADVNDAGVVEWNKPTELVRKRHTGEMVRFKHRGFNLRVTGDHKMWVNYRVKDTSAYKQPDEYVFETASALAKTERMGFKMTAKAAWRDETLETRSFAGIPTCYKQHRTGITVPYAPFARLMGWYLSEGSLAYRRWNGERRQALPVISQNIDRGFDDIVQTIKSCGLTYSVGKTDRELGRRILINSPIIGAYCQPLGDSFEKYIPREFFQSTALLEQVLQGIYLGDACYHEGEPWDTGTLRTRSKRLAEDVQEAWLRLGRMAPIQVRNMDGKPMYEVRANTTDYMVFWRSEYESKERVTTEQVVDEEVYCFTVKNHRVFVKGSTESKPVICSQCYDEFQDMLFEAVVPVVNECMANSSYKFETYAGTPKSMENSMQFLWERSTQSEWVMKCDRCGKHTFIESEKAMGKHGPICLACGDCLDPRRGFWVDMVKPPKDSSVRYVKGFHIPQPILPANVPKSNPGGEEKAQERWNDLLHKLATYPAHRFRNEVLGVSDAAGTRLVSLDELRALSQDYNLSPYPDPKSFHGVSWTVAGVDWSGGGTSGVSRTVLWVYGFVPESTKMRCLYYKVFAGDNPVVDVREIAQTLGMYQVRMVVGDAGEGALPNAMLRDALGHHRCTMVQYGAFAKPITWNGVDRYHVDRTSLIDNYMMQLKQKRVEYATIGEMEISNKDVLNVYEEVTTSGKKVWRHSPQQPDDCLHAQLFAWLAGKMVSGDLKLYDFAG